LHLDHADLSFAFADDGYDIADYYSVDSAYGSLDQLKGMIEAAHQRGIRIIMDLVLNHTSDASAGFRHRAPIRTRPIVIIMSGAMTDQKYKDTRIIFLDTEPSNWTWDEKTGNISGIVFMPPSLI
jgi:maltose alpha-D-glucosyltransferase/alpha-amylase